MKVTGYEIGQFCWVDLQTKDPDLARTFYSKLLGWETRDVVTDVGPSYTIFRRNGLAVAGMSPQSPAWQRWGMPPMWLSYVRVDELEQTVERAKDYGAEVVVPPAVTSEYGCLAVLNDPTGAMFGLWKPERHFGAEWVNDEGGMCWNELYTSNIETSSHFYEKLLGWEFECSKAASREYWTIRNRGRANGGMMAILPEWGDVPPSWSVYFGVEVCAESVSLAQSLGAKLFVPPMTVPNAGTFAGIQDPGGAHLFLLESCGETSVSQ